VWVLRRQLTRQSFDLLHSLSGIVPRVVPTIMTWRPQ
jgi:hypothetical protein